MHRDHDDELHDHDRGLSHDLPTLLNRRRALGPAHRRGARSCAGSLQLGRDLDLAGHRLHHQRGCDPEHHGDDRCGRHREPRGDRGSVPR